ncbi:MAG: histidine kinase dimerization/phospho-acceptor domain-containing protein [Longimonas sp.]|uniref:histidine kinase dimerization/phospho-acceptor domain-containing protein n=1 Tax=Longimonas sp. TaxID=2039626 RepID=UPI003975E97C
MSSLPDAEALHDTLSEIIHDVNNPLSIIHGNAQFLIEVAKEEGEEGAVQEALQDIHDATNQLSERLKRLEELRDGLA